MASNPNDNDKDRFIEILKVPYILPLLQDPNVLPCEIADHDTCDLRLICEDIPSDDGIVYTKDELNDALYTCFYEIGPRGADPDAAATAAVSVLFNRLTMIYKARKDFTEKQRPADQANTNYNANQQKIKAGGLWNKPGDKEKYDQLQEEAKTLLAARNEASKPRDTARDLKIAMESYADNPTSEVITLTNLCNPNQFSGSLQAGKRRKQLYCNGDSAEKNEGNKKAWNAVRSALIALARSKASRKDYVILKTEGHPSDCANDDLWVEVGGNIYCPLPILGGRAEQQKLFKTLMNNSDQVKRGNN